MSSQKRNKKFVDPEIQMALIRRGLIYWFWASVAFAALIFLYRIAPSQLGGTARDPGFWYHFGPVLIASIVTMPAIMINMIWFSHRFVGPMYRLRKELRHLAQGKKVQRVTFRDDDYWREVAEDLNRVAERLARAESRIERDRAVESPAEMDHGECVTHAAGA